MIRLKSFLVSIAFIACFVLASCTNYDGYKRVKLPDDALGSVMLPNEWVVTKENEKIQFVDANTGDVIAEEYYKGIYIHYGSGELIDERVYNEKFQNYIVIEGVEASGNSNGGQYEVFRCRIEASEIKIGSLLFIGNDSNYSLKMYTLHEVPSEILSKIAKSYERKN